MKKNSGIGDDFELDLKIIEAKTRNTVESTRATLAKIVLLAAVCSITAAGVVAVVTKDLGTLPAVWSVVAMPLGAVIGHYFGKAETHEKDNNESST